MSNELTDVRCPCGDEYPADSYDAGFIAGSGMCQNCDAALPPKDICTCPSGDGSLRHPCPAHPAVEQAGGDERAVDGKPRATKCPDCGEGDLMPGDLCACGYETDPAAGYACSECDGSGDGYVGEVCRECDGSGWFVTPEQARAALAQPSPTTDSRPAEWSSYDPTWVVDFIRDNSIFNADLIERMLEYATRPAGDVPQAEKAEAERPEVVAYLFVKPDGTLSMDAVRHKPSQPAVAVMTVAQHERIVKAWIERWKAYIELSAKIAAQRDAALARVAELEKQERPEVPDE
ncbi:TPA: hypothetical protein NIB52_002958 [Pseudomonas aeruginosa]|nr:hypothetical protein [Pseudomonas aeruginosa]